MTIGVLAVALLTLGLESGHRFGAPTPGEALLEYAMPDGTLPTLCVTDGAGGAASGHADADTCPSCVLGAKLALPTRLAAPSRDDVGVHFPAVALLDEAATSVHAPRAPPARGPPATLIF